MPFLDQEDSAYDSEAYEAYTIVAGGTTYYLTSQPVGTTLGGQAYTATPGLRRRKVRRTEIAASGGECEIFVPRAVLPGITPLHPPRPFRVSVRRWQSGGDAALVEGKVTNTKIEDTELVLLVTQHHTLKMARRTPALALIPQCARVLYDSWCRVARGDNHFEADVTAVDGLDVTLDTVDGRPDGYFAGGEFLYAGEKRTITKHVGLVLSIDGQFATAPTGTIVFHPGCDKQPSTCDDKYNNRANFLGAPHRPDENVSVLGIAGLRVTVS